MMPSLDLDKMKKQDDDEDYVLPDLPNEEL